MLRRQVAPFADVLGTTAAECTDRLTLKCTHKGPCQVDETYVEDQAVKCSSGWRTMTCEQLKASKGAEPAACGLSCTRP